jgi:hypothetical protein
MAAAVGGIMNITVIITSQRGVIMLSHLLFMRRRPLFIINSHPCVIINRLCSITSNHSSIRKTVYGCRGKWAFKMIARLLTNGQLCCKIKFDNPHFPA